MASSPVFASIPKFRNIILNNSNGGDSAYINPTTIATVLTMGATGGRIDTVYLQSVGTNADTAVRFFIDTVGTGGADNRLVHEETMLSTTSVSTAALNYVVWTPGIVLPANAVLRATVANTAVTNGIAVSVNWAEF